MFYLDDRKLVPAGRATRFGLRVHGRLLPHCYVHSVDLHGESMSLSYMAGKLYYVLLYGNTEVA